MRQGLYSQVRSQMRPGDLIAFGGKGRFSRLIKWAIRGNVSHVGSVLHRVGGQVTRVELIESTSLYGKPCVQTAAISMHVDEYDGEMWWFPLREHVRRGCNELAYLEEATKILGCPYDFSQAILSALPWWLNWISPESSTRMFCSEAVAHLYEAAGIWSGNASGVNPRELIKADLFGEPIQFKGDPLSPF